MKRYIRSNNDNIHVMYYFYDHLLLRETGEAQEVLKAVQNKDFDTFKKIFDKYPPYTSSDGVTEIFFPTVAYLRNEDGDVLEEIDITTPEGFVMIDEAEFECG